MTGISSGIWRYYGLRGSVMGSSASTEAKYLPVGVLLYQLN
ncbi:MAG TPA: hypothetical protein VKR32_00900 [Puia sp.]|nr:hypothetical protein [Puia sp.]